jgi:hypothetical protein
MMTTRRFGDFAIYAIVGLVLIAFSLTASQLGWADSTFRNVLSFIVQFCFVFGYTIYDHRRSWGRRSFWIILSAGLGIHVLVFTYIALRVEVWNGGVLVLPPLIEYYALNTFLVKAGGAGA